MNLEPKKPIIVTGGHHNSALLIAIALKEKDYLVHWLGHRHTMVGDPHDSLEYLEVTAAGIPFHSLLAGKFHSQANPLHLLRLPLGFMHALWLLLRLRPQLILAFGGYIAVPVGIIGWLLRIPLILFEQTTTVGRGNQLLSRLSQHNFLAWPSSLPFFPPAKTQVVGLPLPKELIDARKPQGSTPPTILVTGGKQGAHVLNQVVFTLIPKLVQKFVIIHQTGRSLHAADSQKAQMVKASLPQTIRSRYQSHPFLTSTEMIDSLKKSDLVVSRAGAHICYELLSLGKPSILIPLPFSFNKEQQQNAAVLDRAGIALIINQDQLTPKRLEKMIATIFRHSATFLARGKTARKLILPQAQQIIMDYLLKFNP